MTFTTAQLLASRPSLERAAQAITKNFNGDDALERADKKDAFRRAVEAWNCSRDKTHAWKNKGAYINAQDRWRENSGNKNECLDSQALRGRPSWLDTHNVGFGDAAAAYGKHISKVWDGVTFGAVYDAMMEEIKENVDMVEELFSLYARNALAYPTNLQYGVHTQIARYGVRRAASVGTLLEDDFAVLLPAQVAGWVLAQAAEVMTRNALRAKGAQFVPVSCEQDMFEGFDLRLTNGKTLQVKSGRALTPWAHAKRADFVCGWKAIVQSDDVENMDVSEFTEATLTPYKKEGLSPFVWVNAKGRNKVFQHGTRSLLNEAGVV